MPRAWPGGGAAGAASGGGSFFSWLIKLLPGFEQGGVVPSAAGGWAVPSLGAGGILAQLHSNEMVLPSGLSQFVQNAAAQAGGAGGGGPVYNLSITAWDARSVMAAGPHIVAAINKATRNGSPLRTS